MSCKRADRSKSQWTLRDLLIGVATFTVAAAAAVFAGLLALGLFLTVPYFVSASSETLGALLRTTPTTNAAPAYVWWIATIGGLIVGLRVLMVVFWKVEPTASGYLQYRFGVQQPIHLHDDNDKY